MVAAVESSEALLVALCESQFSHQLVQAWPLSVSLLLQFGLMFLYPFWVEESPSVLLDRQALQKRIASVKNLLLLNMENDPRAGAGGNNAGLEIAEHLDSLCKKTMQRRQATPEASLPQADGPMEYESSSMLEHLNYADWQSLMLPNEFLISELDLMQSYEPWYS